MVSFARKWDGRAYNFINKIVRVVDYFLMLGGFSRSGAHHLQQKGVV